MTAVLHQQPYTNVVRNFTTSTPQHTTIAPQISMFGKQQLAAYMMPASSITFSACSQALPFLYPNPVTS